MHEFQIRGNARAPGDVTLEEWLDALAYEKTRSAQQQQKRIEAGLHTLHAERELREIAIARTAEADAAYVGPRLNAREARALEVAPAPLTPEREPHPAAAHVEVTSPGYDALMDELLAADRDGDA